MTSTTLLDLAIALGLIVYICVRQLSWRRVDPARMWKLPLILGAVGIFSIAREAPSVHPVDLAILALSAVLALASGVLMGRVARFRPSPADPQAIESRTGWLGVALWFGLVACRVAIDVAGHWIGSDLAVSLGTVLLVVALNRVASAMVVTARQPRRVPVLAGK